MPRRVILVSAPGAAPCSPCPMGSYIPMSWLRSAPWARLDSALTLQLQPARLHAVPVLRGNTLPILFATCSDCPAGKFSPAQSAACTLCTAGTYSTGVGQPASPQACQECLVGAYSQAGVSSCSLCLARDISPVNKAATCSNCAGGKYMSAT